MDIAKAIQHVHLNNIIHGDIRLNTIFMIRKESDTMHQQVVKLSSLHKACANDMVRVWSEIHRAHVCVRI